MRVVLEKQQDSDGATYYSLTVGREYVVLGIAADWYRILDDTEDPCLFDPSCFRVVDSTEPSFWQSSEHDGVRYAYPPEWDQVGFFEDFHDHVESVVRRFWHDLDRYYPELFAPGT